MNLDDRFDSLIMAAVTAQFPALLADFGASGWLWVKAQCWQESRMNPLAVSSCGAVGLLQLMPATDLGIDGDLDGFDPAGNIDNGVRYLAEQYQKFAEIPSPADRLRFALAAYNGGRGYVNRALELARAACDQPAAFAAWKKTGMPAGQWQGWGFAHPYLADARCQVKGKRPDHKQITDYVAHIEGRYRHYAKGWRP
jgi:membrane-bound lytic murein transglycosylase MltF